MQEFEPETESISAYLERLQMFFDANNIADEKKVSVLLTVIGKNTFSLLRNLLAPTSPKDKSLELTAMLKAHFEPKPLVIAERFDFYRRDQRAGESIMDFVADLRCLTVKCEFETFLDQALRDRFVCGLRSESIQKRLLSEDSKLTFTKAVEIAQGMESAASKAKEFKGATPGVLKVTPLKPCFRCGRSNHDEQVCHFRHATCHNCGKVGHIAPACKSQKTSTRSRYRSKRRKPPDKNHWVELESEASEAEEVTLYTVGEKAANPIKVDVLVNNRSLTMELDTGAAVSIISDTTRIAVFPTDKLLHSSVNLKTYTGEAIQVVGELLVNVQYGQQEGKQLPLIVVKGDGPPLLGRNWLQHVRLDWKLIKKVIQTLREVSNCCRRSTRTCSKTNLVMCRISKPRSWYEKTLGQSFSSLDQFLLP